jgi:TolA-binding protein
VTAPRRGSGELEDRLLFQIGRDFDALAEPRPGDEALVSRAARAALAKRSSVRLPRRIPTLLAAMAAVVATGVVAWAALESAHRREQRSSGAVPATAPPSETAPNSGAPVANATPSLTPASQPADPGRAVDRDPHVKPGVVTRRPALASETAADVFREAAAARRLGDVERACSLYLELQRRFPRSGEAQLSQISLGKLLLQTGRASEADHHFAAYLSSGGGELAEEALVGRAESSQQLARRDEERHAWDQLLRDHPRSVYAAQAKRRIEELDGAAP